MQKHLLILISILFAAPVAKAQHGNFGILAGGNLDFLSFKSDYAFDPATDAKPCLSYNTGGYFKTGMGTFNIRATLDYMRIKNRMLPDLMFHDMEGMFVGTTSYWNINHYISVGCLGTVKIFKGMNAGVGIRDHILLKSYFKMQGDYDVNGVHLDNFQANTYYRRMVITVPVMLEYEIKNMEIFVQFDKGVMNRIKKGSYIREIDNILMVGLGYNFPHK